MEYFSFTIKIFRTIILKTFVLPSMTIYRIKFQL